MDFSGIATAEGVELALAAGMVEAVAGSAKRWQSARETRPKGQEQRQNQ